MQSSEGKLKRVTRLSELCTERAMEKKLSTESLLSLPYEVLRALFGNSPGSRSSIIVINDSPLQVGENVINGVICGFHALSRKFIFGEYETAVFMEPLENVTWKFSVHVTGIVMYIQDFLHDQARDVCSKQSLFSSLECMALENRKRIEDVLYQEVARWIFKYNCYFAFKLSDEFIKLTQKDTRKLKMAIF